MSKPSIAELLSASSYTTYTPELVSRAMYALYGNLGANLDERSWSGILQSNNPLQAAEAGLLTMYQDSGYLLRNTQHLEHSGYVAAQAEYTYRQIADRLGFSYSPTWSMGTPYENLGSLSNEQLIGLVPAPSPPLPAISVAGSDAGFVATLNVAGEVALSVSGALGNFSAGNSLLTQQTSIREGYLTLTSNGNTSAATSQYVVLGTAGDDTLDTSNAGDRVDFIYTGSGINTTTPGGGADQVILGNGTDTLIVKFGDTGSPAIQKIDLRGTLENNDQYTVTLAGGALINAGPISGGATAILLADLVDKLEASKGINPITFSTGTGADTGKIVITYNDFGSVTGEASIAQTSNAGILVRLGTAEVQKIAFTGALQANDQYAITLAGGTVVTSGAIAGADTAALRANLVAQLESAKGSNPVTFSVGTGVDVGNVIITYSNMGDVSGAATIAQTSNAGVAVSAGKHEVQKITLTGSLADGDQYKVILAGDIPITSGTILGNSEAVLQASLVTALTNSKGSMPINFSMGTGDDIGKLIITYSNVGNVAEKASIVQTSNARTAVQPGTTEVQKIILTGTLQADDQYTVTLAGGQVIVSGAIAGADGSALQNNLIARLEAAKGGNPVAFSAGTDGDSGKIIITYNDTGDVIGTAAIAQTYNAGVAISAGTREVQKITLTGDLTSFDQYTVTLASGAKVSSANIDAIGQPALLEKLASGLNMLKGSNLVTFSAGAGIDIGKLIITYDQVGSVTGEASINQTYHNRAVINGAAELQRIKITGILKANDQYTIKLASGAEVDSGSIAGINTTALLENLIANLEAAKGSNPVIFSLATGYYAGDILITYSNVGNVTGLATMTQTFNAGVAVSSGRPEVHKIALTGNLADYDQYTVTLADGSLISSGNIIGADQKKLLANLVFTLNTAKGSDKNITFSEGIDLDAGKLIITYNSLKNIDGEAVISQTFKDRVEISTSNPPSVTGATTVIEGVSIGISDVIGTANTPTKGTFAISPTVTGSTSAINGVPANNTDVIGAVFVTHGENTVNASVTGSTVSVDGASATPVDVSGILTVFSGINAVNSDVAGITTTQSGAILVNSDSNDTVTGFSIGTDKIKLLMPSHSTVTPSSLIRVSDVSWSNDLDVSLKMAFSELTENQAGLVVISTGTAAGTYLYADNGNGNVDLKADIFIKLVGTVGTLGFVGGLPVGDFFA